MGGFPPVADMTAFTACLQTMAMAMVKSNAPAEVGGNSAQLQKVEDQLRKLELDSRDARERQVREEERTKRAEAERDDLRQQLCRQQNENAETLRKMQGLQMDHVKQVEELKGESRTVRDNQKHGLSDGVSASTESTLHVALKVAESALKVAESTQQAVNQLRAESGHDSATAKSRLDALEDRIERRFQAWDANTRSGDSLKPITSGITGRRIAEIHNMHFQQTGARNPSENAPGILDVSGPYTDGGFLRRVG